MQSKLFINNIYNRSNLNGFTLIELIVSVMIMTMGFLGIMTLYMDVIKNYTRDQIIEEARFALSSQIEKITEDIKGASDIEVIPGFQTRIKITSGDGSETVYSCRNNEGLLKDGRQSVDFYGNTISQLFENNEIYLLEVKCDEFDCKKNLSSMGNGDRIRNNFYTVTAEFELTSTIDDDFKKIYKFERDAFAQNMFSSDQDDEE